MDCTIKESRNYSPGNLGYIYDIKMKQSQEFKERKEIMALKVKFLELEHKLKIERLEFERENARIFHDLALQRERIKSAEIRKSQMRKHSSPWEIPK